MWPEDLVVEEMVVVTIIRLVIVLSCIRWLHTQ